LEKFRVDVNAVGKVKHFGSIVDGATALWCAAGEYADIFLWLPGVYPEHIYRGRAFWLKFRSNLSKNFFRIFYQNVDTYKKKLFLCPKSVKLF